MTKVAILQERDPQEMGLLLIGEGFRNTAQVPKH